MDCFYPIFLFSSLFFLVCGGGDNLFASFGVKLANRFAKRRRIKSNEKLKERRVGQAKSQPRDTKIQMDLRMRGGE